MSIPEPHPNGELPPKPDDFEMKLEPVDPAELNIEQPPMVEEIGRPRRRGFGFWMGLAWCALFLFATQGIPSTILTAVYGVRIGERSKQLIREAEADPAKPVDFDTLLRKIMDSPEMRQMTQIALLVAPACGILFSLLVLRRFVGKEWRRRLALRLPHLEHVILILLLFFPVFVFNLAFEGMTKHLPSWVDQFNMPGMKELMETMLTWPAWIVTLGVAIGPAVSEELFCRGFLGHGLIRRFGTRRGVVLTSFFFGLIHLSLIQSIFAAGIGIILHSVYLATRSLLAPIFLHFLNNFFALPAESESIPIYMGTSLQHALDFRPWSMLLTSLLMFAVVVWALWVSRVRVWSADGKEQHYVNVALPSESSGDRALMGNIPVIVVGMLLVAIALFGAIWFGF